MTPKMMQVALQDCFSRPISIGYEMPTELLVPAGNWLVRLWRAITGRPTYENRKVTGTYRVVVIYNKHPDPDVTFRELTQAQLMMGDMKPAGIEVVLDCVERL